MIGAVIALDSEASALLDQMDMENLLTVHGKPVYLGKAFGKDVALCVCGVGKVNAAVGVMQNNGVHGRVLPQPETEAYCRHSRGGPCRQAFAAYRGDKQHKSQTGADKNVGNKQKAYRKHPYQRALVKSPAL